MHYNLTLISLLIITNTFIYLKTIRIKDDLISLYEAFFSSLLYVYLTYIKFIRYIFYSYNSALLFFKMKMPLNNYPLKVLSY